MVTKFLCCAYVVKLQIEDSSRGSLTQNPPRFYWSSPLRPDRYQPLRLPHHQKSSAERWPSLLLVSYRPLALLACRKHSRSGPTSLTVFVGRLPATAIARRSGTAACRPVRRAASFCSGSARGRANATAAPQTWPSQPKTWSSQRCRSARRAGTSAAAVSRRCADSSRHCS